MPGAYVELMKRSRKREGLSIYRAAWLLGVTPAAYKHLEAGEEFPDSDTWHRMVEVFYWPRSWG
jgi:predicted transcriptional regulator